MMMPLPISHLADNAAKPAVQRQAEMRVCFDLMPVIIFFKDTANRWLRANPRPAASVGKSNGRLEGISAIESNRRVQTGTAPVCEASV